MSIVEWFNRQVSSAPVAPPVPAPVDTVLDDTRKLLALREGRRTTVYADSLGKPTVGIGHLVKPADRLSLGAKITDAQVDEFFRVDIESALSTANALARSAGITDSSFVPYLTSVCYQMGNAWTGKFPNTWAMVCRGEYERAALALNGTPWAAQTPVRVADFQAALRRLPPKP